MPHSRIRTHPALIVSVVVALALTWSPICLANGAQSVTYQVSKTQTVDVLNPCLGPIEATLTYDGVVHVTEDGDVYHVITAVHGTALVVPSDPTEPPFFGPFAEIQTLVLNRDNAVSTFVVTQVGPGGLAFHITFLLVLEPSGAEIFLTNVAC